MRAEDTADFVYWQWLQISRFDPLTESLLLALIGAGLGVVLAYRALRFIVARLPEYSFPHEADFHVNLPMLLFSVSLAVFTGVLFGVFPALESARREINHVIQAGTHKMAGSVRGKRMHTGLTYRLTSNGSDGWLQIIGVVSDALDDGLDKPVLPALYVPYTVNMFMGTQILVRTQGEPLSMLHGIRKEIAAVNPDQQVDSNVQDLEGWIRRESEFAISHLISILFGAFSSVAMVLAGVGLYSVVSYSVVQRTSEFGIRMALGAQRADVLRIVVWSAIASVGIGLAAGLALSFGLGSVITRWVHNGVNDPLLVLGVSVLVIVVAALACLVPSLPALAVDPMTALRCE